MEIDDDRLRQVSAIFAERDEYLRKADELDRTLRDLLGLGSDSVVRTRRLTADVFNILVGGKNGNFTGDRRAVVRPTQGRHRKMADAGVPE